MPSPTPTVRTHRRTPWLCLPALAVAACHSAPPPGPSPEPPPPAAPAQAPAPVLSPTDLRPQFAAFGLPPRGQGHRPTCSIFTTVAAFEFAFARATGRGERLSVEYANWAANAATGRTDDGDFFHCALAGYDRFGLCGDPLQPYAATFANVPPPPDALVEAGRRQGQHGDTVRTRWIRPIGGGAGLSAEQFTDVLQTLAHGHPVAAGSAHSRLLVGYRDEAGAPGGGVFLTLDSALAAFAEVSAEFVRTQVNDAFVVEAVAPARQATPGSSAP